MLLYLLLGAAGLFVLAKVVSSSSDSQEDVPFRTLLSAAGRIDALSGKLDMVVSSEERARSLAKEKYADPIFFCNNEPWTIINVPAVSYADLYGDGYEYRFEVEAAHARELAYLEGSKPQATTRVATMRAYVTSRAGVTGAPILRAFERASFKKMQEYGISLINGAYANAANMEALARDLGDPLDVVRAQGQKLLQAAGLPGKAGDVAIVETLLREVKPAVAAINASISNFSKEISSYATTHSNEAASALQAFSKFSAAIPVVGALVNFSMNIYSAAEAEYRKDMAETCQNALVGIDTIIKDLVSSNFPVSLRTFDMSCGEPHVRVKYLSKEAGEIYYNMTSGQFEAFQAYFRILYGLEKTSIYYRAFISRWWATALTFMSNPRVGDVFRAMGEHWDFASDEQVMLVAAPFAVANDIAVDVFARVLWDRCEGYQTASASMLDAKETTTGCWIARQAAFVQLGMIAETAVTMVNDYVLVSKMREESRPVLKEVLTITIPL